MKGNWYIQFWDFGQWDACAGPFAHKRQAIDRCQELNRRGPYSAKGGFDWQEGHRYRVRNVQS